MKVIMLKVKDRDGKIKKLNNIIIDKDKGLVDEEIKRDRDKQISILSARVRNLIDDKKINGLCASRFYENITIEDLKAKELSLGTKLRIGDTIQEITYLGKRCFKECKLVEEEKRCDLSQEAIFTRVLKGGIISKNDRVDIEY